MNNVKAASHVAGMEQKPRKCPEDEQPFIEVSHAETGLRLDRNRRAS
jgi:hypothetical protein